MPRGVVRLWAMSIAVRSIALGMHCKLGDESCLADGSIEGRSMLHYTALAHQPPLESATAPPASAEEVNAEEEEEAIFEPEQADLTSAAEDPDYMAQVAADAAEFITETPKSNPHQSTPTEESVEFWKSSVYAPDDGDQEMPLQADKEAAVDSDNGHASTEAEADAEAKDDEFTDMSIVMEAEKKLQQADEADEEAPFDSDNGDAEAEVEAKADEASQVKYGEATPKADMEDTADEEADFDSDDGEAVDEAEAKADKAAEIIESMTDSHKH